MTKKQLNKEFEGIAKNILFIKTLEYRGCDGLDFYDNDDGSISVGSIKEALECSYNLGVKEGKKAAMPITKIKLDWDMGTAEVGKQVTFNGKTYTLVGIHCDSFVFACLKPDDLDDAMVKILTRDEIDEYIEDGSLKGWM